MNEQELLLALKSNATDLFVKNNADITAPTVIAAITEVASKMSLATDSDSSLEDTQEAMLKVFGATDNEEVRGMMGMADPMLVRNAIGYTADYMDYNKARITYESEKAKYDELYDGLALINKKEMTK